MNLSTLHVPPLPSEAICKRPCFVQQPNKLVNRILRKGSGLLPSNLAARTGRTEKVEQPHCVREGLDTIGKARFKLHASTGVHAYVRHLADHYAQYPALTPLARATPSGYTSLLVARGSRGVRAVIRNQLTTGLPPAPLVSSERIHVWVPNVAHNQVSQWSPSKAERYRLQTSRSVWRIGSRCDAPGCKDAAEEQGNRCRRNHAA